VYSLGTRGRALARLFEDLADGDPVAWIGVGVFAAIALALGLFVLKVKCDLDRDDKKRSGKK
jgi:hypothetical protein